MNELLHRNNINALKEELVTEQNRLQRADNKQDIDFFCWQYEVSLLEFSYNIRTHNRDMSASACDWLNATDCYIVLLKLRTLVGALSRKNVLKQDYCIRWQQEIINSVEKEPFSNIPLLQMYRLVVLLLTNAADSTTYYDELRILLKEHHHQIGHSELLQLYVLCINYELKRTKEHGNNAENIFSLYKEMDSSSVFDHHIQNVLYTHAIKFAAQVQQFKWADTFLEKYKDKIAVENTNDREYIYNYSRALWHFHKGDLKGAMYLLGTEYPDAYYYMERKVTLMKIYYQIETKEDDLFNEIKAVKTYLSRDKTMADQIRCLAPILSDY